ncbi:MAG: deoxyguanosinetriphosphate triphosphohydrolase [Ezakiella sp.]|nr:deoxyguanosinetriphosphate triphosphohydrolase [Ezakiella sp.]MDD7761197.1 deoxyguanosinetriphosphate triphosphohydrolase [Bacillota bacterium]MDY3946819.1 deoxyguanosinetriphosphate triphosphohydrolase [Ezakiella sp.]
MSIREDIEKREHEFLSPYASFADRSKGRRLEEAKCDIRSDYQRDRDRIIHSKSFRRLKHKTQVYIAPIGDHFRTRLTHTLEVAQIARTIARALRLNEDLTEAIALGHDMGHTPFGHSGERALDEISPYGFRHNENSLRVVDLLENKKKGFGLNLTYEVRDGILHHSGDELASTLEGKIIKYSDRIAYINHDIDDSIRAGNLCEDDIPSDITDLLGTSASERIDFLVKDLIANSIDQDDISMSSEVEKMMLKLRQFMFDNVYLDERAKIQGEKITMLISSLYDYYKKHPKDMGDHLNIYDKDEDIDRIVTDYIAGMTDLFATQKFKEIYLPTSYRRV